MTETKLLELMAQMRARVPPGEGNEEKFTHPGGISFSRARLLVLNPARWTAEEHAHVASCRRCAHLIESAEHHLPHPAWSQLLRKMLGRLTENEVKLLRYHLEEGECQRCLRLVESPWLKSLAALVRAGQRTLEQAQTLLDQTVTAFASLPALKGAFAGDNDVSPPFTMRGEHPDGSLTVVAREDAAKDLVVDVETPDSARAGQTVQVEIVGEGEALTAEIQLAAENGTGCFGQHRFPDFPGLASRLGANCVITGHFA